MVQDYLLHGRQGLGISRQQSEANGWFLDCWCRFPWKCWTFCLCLSLPLWLLWFGLFRATCFLSFSKCWVWTCTVETKAPFVKKSWTVFSCKPWVGQEPNTWKVRKNYIYYDKIQHAHFQGNLLFLATEQQLNNS